MGKYYSPTGNFEVWETKPDGYYTVEEWKELHPTPEPTKTEKLAQLEAQYEAQKNELKGYLMDAMLLDDADTIADLKQEMAEIEAEYQAKREELEG